MRNCTSIAFAICKHHDCRLLSYSITNFFKEISPYETPHKGASEKGMHCLPVCPINSSLKLIVSYPLLIMRIKIGKNRLSTCRTKQSSPLKQMHNIWLGASLLGAEFVRGPVCQGPSLSGAEMTGIHYVCPTARTYVRHTNDFRSRSRIVLI